MNPLLIDLVLESLLENVPIKDLAACRLVCRKWRDASLMIWRKNATINIVQLDVHRDMEKIRLENEYEYWTWKLEPTTEITLMGLQAEMEMNDSLCRMPFRNYKLLYWDLSIRAIDLTDFWKQCGSRMKTLCFDNCTLWNGTRKIIQKLLLEYTTNLEALSIKYCTHLPRRSNDASYSLCYSNSCLKKLQIEGSLRNYTALFTDHPNLHSLIFSSVRSIGDINRILRNLAAANVQVKHLDTIYASHCILTPLNLISTFPLESLTFTVSYNIDASFLVGQIQAYTKTLKSLKIYAVSITNAFQNLPFHATMTCLTELVIYGYLSKDLSFLQKMPKLKRLAIYFAAFRPYKPTLCFIMEMWDKRIWDQLGQYALLWKDGYRYSEYGFNFTLYFEECGFGEMVFTSLDSLSVDYEFDIKSLKLLKRYMPNIVSLGTILINKTLRVVVNLWPKLEELHCIFGSKVDDVGITGIVPRGKPLPSITTLSCLKRLKLDTFRAGGRIRESSCHDGFFLMKCLQTLELWVYKPCISVQSELQLKETISHVKIHRNFTRQQNHLVIMYSSNIPGTNLI